MSQLESSPVSAVEGNPAPCWNCSASQCLQALISPVPGRPCPPSATSPALPHMCAWQPSAVRSIGDISSSIITTTLHHVLHSTVLFSSEEQKAACSLQPDGVSVPWRIMQGAHRLYLLLPPSMGCAQNHPNIPFLQTFAEDMNLSCFVIPAQELWDAGEKLQTEGPQSGPLWLPPLPWGSPKRGGSGYSCFSSLQQDLRFTQLVLCLFTALSAQPS